ncbi:uncharacterized protein LOC129566524 [Sitodiplosis mosellana]|uniref:uncharacterized protein LOC129566524 n=1 Tax=Sitodiplosis mosellana TaxID=263140 RepID=UPI002443F898|nr:uncharacterized protein LOC129566524 [Sitodiplosis mosellana]
MPVPEENRTQHTNEMNGFNADVNKTWVYSLLVNLSKMWRTGTSSFDLTLEQYGVYEIIDWIVQHLSRHPFLAFGMSMCVLSCALPFIIFMIFAIATVIMTFTSFVIIEGTLITMASALLFGFLGAVILFFFFFGFVMMAGYFGLVQIYELLDYPNKRRAVVNYFRGETPSQAAEKKRD